MHVLQTSFLLTTCCDLIDPALGGKESSSEGCKLFRKISPLRDFDSWKCTETLYHLVDVGKSGTMLDLTLSECNPLFIMNSLYDLSAEEWCELSFVGTL
jgi:hypothetical protein